MKLKDFIEKYICKNTLIRLWIPINKCQYKMIHDKEKEVSMEWQILQDESFLSKYKDNEVIGITDILCETYKEAVNIVIKE